MTIEDKNENVALIAVEDDFTDDWMEGGEDDVIIDNAAVLTIDYDAQQLIAYFGGNRNAVMELDDDFEVSLCDQVLSDPNFWANFFGSLSAAIKKNV